MMNAVVSSDERRPAGIRGAYVPVLEGLRGVAILLVFSFHASGALGALHAGQEVSVLQAFATAGHTGVSLFFVLSAYLLSRPFLAGLADARTPDASSFFRRRALRIAPLYVFVVCVATLVSAGGPADLLRALPHLAFLSNVPAWSPGISAWSGVWWSLSTEVQFYLLLPLFFLPLAANPRRAVAAGLTIAWLVLWVGLMVGAPWAERGSASHVALSLGVVGRGAFFAVGIAVAWLDLRFGDRQRSRFARNPWLRRGVADALLLGTLLALGQVLQIYSITGYFRTVATLPEWVGVEALLWGATLLLLLWLPTWSARLIASRPLQWIGVVSYSLYLWHEPILKSVLVPLRDSKPEQFMGWTLASGLTVAACLAACLALSALTYRWIERPFLLLKARG